MGIRDHLRTRPYIRVEIHRQEQHPGWCTAYVYYRWMAIVGTRFQTCERRLAETWSYSEPGASVEMVAAQLLHDCWLALEDRLD